MWQISDLIVVVFCILAHVIIADYQNVGMMIGILLFLGVSFFIYFCSQRFADVTIAVMSFELGKI